jgi:CDP-diacylglycerol--inositol 3-phosphatidyltransferase
MYIVSSGYFRLLLLVFAWLYWDYPKTFLVFYITQVLLDGLEKIFYFDSKIFFSCCCLAVDGWAARRFNQVSRFGAWLDVIIDNIGRGILWTRVSTVKKELIE